MEFWETILLIKAIKWLWRWLSSNEKNRKVIEKTILDDVVQTILDALEEKNG